MSFNAPRDEIPGITSFLYEANRHRQLNEYTNAWKMERELHNKASKLNLNPEDLHAILGKLEELDHSVKQLEDLNDELYHQKEEFKDRSNELADKLDSAQSIADTAKSESTVREKQRIEALFLLFQFGDHKPDCGYLEVLESGRALNIDEKKECTCGWIDLRDKIVQNPENLQLLKDEVDQENPLNAKPLKAFRELETD